MASENNTELKIPKIEYYTKTAHHSSYDRISPLRSELSAKGRNIVVTGGGTGIGKAIAMSFAQAGAKSVTILGRRENRLKEAVKDIENVRTATETQVIYKVVDLTDDQAVNTIFQSISAEVGKVNVLVSNAAILPEPGPIVGYDAANLIHGFQANVISSFNAVQAFLSVRTEDAILLNISTSIAHMKPIPYTSGYGITKAANLKMIDYFATEVKDLHVVNVQPGTCETEMSAQVKVKAPDTVDLPGDFCVWLASPEARFLKSKFVWANWDVDELLAQQEVIQNSDLFVWRLDGSPM